MSAARERLPNRRRSEILEFDHEGNRFTLGLSRFPDGGVAEVFISSSIALQFGADLRTIRGALTRNFDGGPATLLGAALDALAGAL